MRVAARSARYAGNRMLNWEQLRSRQGAGSGKKVRGPGTGSN